MRVAEQRAHHRRPVVDGDDHRAEEPAPRRHRRVRTPPCRDLLSAVLPVGDAVADAPRVVPEQLGQQRDIVLGQRPFVPLERGADRCDDVRTVEDGPVDPDRAVLDPRFDPERHAVGRPSTTGAADSVRDVEERGSGTPAPGSGAARSAATGWSSRTPSSRGAPVHDPVGQQHQPRRTGSRARSGRRRSSRPARRGSAR